MLVGLMSNLEVPNLKLYKHRKKFKKLVEDINHVIQVFEASQQALSHFKYIIVCQEVISIMETNKTILTMKSKELQKELDKIYV